MNYPLLLVLVGASVLLMLLEWRGLPMTLVYGVGYFTSVGIGIMVALRLWRLASGRLSDAELRIFAGEYQDERAAHTRQGIE